MGKTELDCKGHFLVWVVWFGFVFKDRVSLYCLGWSYVDHAVLELIKNGLFLSPKR